MSKSWANFHFWVNYPFKHPCRKTHHGHIPGWQSQDSSGSNCERMVGREHEESFSLMNCHQTLNSLKVFGMCWRRLYRELDSCIDNIQDLDQKLMHLLMEINVMLFPSRGTYIHSYLDNARVQHSVKSPPAHPKDSK